MRNPFKTKTLVWVTPDTTHIVKIPFFGKIKQELIKTKKLKGRKIDLIIVDEITRELN